MVGCNKCNFTGFIAVVEEDSLEWKACECRKVFDKNYQSNIYIRESNILGAEALKTSSLEDFSTIHILEQFASQITINSLEFLRSLIKDPKKILEQNKVIWLYGESDPYTYSLLSSTLGVELIIKFQYRVKFIRSLELFRAFRSFGNLEKQHKFFDIIKDFDLFIIDKFDSEIHENSNYMQMTLFDFFDSILMSGKKFIITSNSHPNKLLEIYDKTMRAILSFAEVVQIDFNKKSHVDPHEIKKEKVKTRKPIVEENDNDGINLL